MQGGYIDTVFEPVKYIRLNDPSVLFKWMLSTLKTD